MQSKNVIAAFQVQSLKKVEQYFQDKYYSHQVLSKIFSPYVAEIAAILSQNQKVVLIHGEAGSGKTSLCQLLATYFWETWLEASIMPIYCSAEALEKNQSIDVLLQEQGLTAETIESLRLYQQVIFIFDDIGVETKLTNIYAQYQLEQWKNAKVIVTCSNQIINQLSDESVYFAPMVNNKLQRTLFKKWSLPSLTLPQLTALTEHTLKSQGKQSSNEEIDKIMGILKKHFSLLKISENLILSSFLFPLLINDKVKHYLTKDLDHLYHQVFSQWFASYQRKYAKIGLFKEGEDFQEKCLVFCHSLSLLMKDNDKNIILHRPAAKISHKASPWSPFFDNHNIETKLVRAACPLISPQKYQYQWLCDEVKHYFGALSVDQNKKFFKEKEVQQNIKPLLSKKEASSASLYHDRLNKILRTNDPVFLQFLADKIIHDASFKEHMFRLITSSCNDPKMQIAAANALTALCYARVPLSKLNLSYIQAPHANLSYGIFDGTNLYRANLSRSYWQNAWLRECQLQEADLTDTDFGESLFLEYPDKIREVCYSPDGRWLAVVSASTTFIHDARTYELKLTLKGADPSFSPSGRLMGLYCKGHDITPRGVYVWNLEAMKQLFRFLPPGDIQGTTFDMDERIIVVGTLATGYSLSNQLWVQVDREIRIFSYKYVIFARAISQNGKRIASACDDSPITILNVNSGEIEQTFEYPSKSLSFSPTSEILTSVYENTLFIFDLLQKQLKYVIEGCNGDRHVFDKTGRTIAVFGYLEIIIINVLMAKILHRLQGHTGIVENVIFTADSSILISSSRDQSICVWDLNTGKLKTKFLESTYLKERYNIANCIALSPDEKTLVAPEGNKLRLWQMDHKMQVSSGKNEEMDWIAVQPDKNLVAVANNQGAIQVRQIITSRILFDAQVSNRTSLAFSSDGQMLASAGIVFVNVWNVNDGKIQYELCIADESYKVVAFDASNQLLAIVGNENLYLWSIKTKQYYTIQSPFLIDVTCMVWDNAGRLIVASYDYSIKCWAPATQSDSSIIWVLDWNTHPNLYSYGCTIENAKNLSSENYLLLEHQGAVGQPLEVTSEKEQPKVINPFVQEGGALKQSKVRSVAALNEAILRGNISAAISLTLSQDVDINSKDEYSMTPLHYATKLGFLKLVEELLNRGADFEARDQGGRTPIFMTVYCSESPYLERIIECFVNSKANLNAQSNTGLTLLDLAVSIEEDAIVHILLKNHADLRLYNSMGETPLHTAIFFRNKSIVNLLIAHDRNIIDIPATETGKTPLCFAIYHKKEDIVEALLLADANVDIKDKAGNLPLNDIVNLSQESTIKLLLKKNIHNLSVRNNNGVNVLKRASFYKKQELIIRLLSEIAIEKEKFKEQINAALTFFEKEEEYVNQAHGAFNKNNYKEAALYYEKAIEQSPLQSYYSAMACCYFAQAIVEHDLSLTNKAENNFQIALQLDVSTGICALFANFLYYYGRFEEAIPLLIQAIHLDDFKRIRFDLADNVFLPEELANELKAGPVIIDAKILAYYLLTLIYKTDNQLEMARELLSDYVKTVNESPTALSYALLGYAHKGCQLNNDAASYFNKACQYKEDYALAKENRDICLGLSELNNKSSVSEANSLIHAQMISCISPEEVKEVESEKLVYIKFPNLQTAKSFRDLIFQIGISNIHDISRPKMIEVEIGEELDKYLIILTQKEYHFVLAYDQCESGTFFGGKEITAKEHKAANNTYEWGKICLKNENFPSAYHSFNNSVMFFKRILIKDESYPDKQNINKRIQKITHEYLPRCKNNTQ